MFGPLRQIGYVVGDIEAAMRHWVDVCGVGPWFYFDRYTVSDWHYRGRPVGEINVSVALANWGELQVELIQQRCNTPSQFRDFLAAGRDGIQHWAVWPENYDEMLARALAAGFEVEQNGATPRGRAAFLARPEAPDTVVELSETGQARLDFAARIRDAARDWDGSNPILRQ
jgi:hypothetical protein